MEGLVRRPCIDLDSSLRWNDKRRVVEDQADKLRTEGHTIVAGKGKKPPTVKDWEKKLVEV